jgi:hypothetical protein
LGHGSTHRASRAGSAAGRAKNGVQTSGRGRSCRCSAVAGGESRPAVASVAVELGDDRDLMLGALGRARRGDRVYLVDCGSGSPGRGSVNCWT